MTGWKEKVNKDAFGVNGGVSNDGDINDLPSKDQRRQGMHIIKSFFKELFQPPCVAINSMVNPKVKLVVNQYNKHWVFQYKACLFVNIFSIWSPCTAKMVSLSRTMVGLWWSCIRVSSRKRSDYGYILKFLQFIACWMDAYLMMILAVDTLIMSGWCTWQIPLSGS